ncbi:MAG: response regulator [Spirochaetia bacterium]|nr:response regulator [Spirochaetia bacterium]
MKTILAVDDSAAMLNMVRQALEFGGYKVLVAEDGRQALERLKQAAAVDLIVTDINMPVMDGITFIKEFRKNNADTPILTLTTEYDDDVKKTGFEAGANGWIVKPFQPAQFLDIVKQLLN